MSSSINPYVKVMLDKERTLCYGAAAFIEFKEATDQDLLKYMRQLAAKFAAMAPKDGVENDEPEIPFKEFRNILWAGLIHEDPHLSPRDVSRMFSLHNMMDLVPLVMDAFALSMPKPSGEERPRMAPVKARKSIGA